MFRDTLIMSPSTAHGDATEDRVYGGDSGLIHIADGERATFGRLMADELDQAMRIAAYNDGRRTEYEADTQTLCPGCYMVAGFNMLVELAKTNGQSLRELGRSMAGAFMALAAEGGPANIEHIGVILDASADFGPEYGALNTWTTSLGANA